MNKMNKYKKLMSNTLIFGIGQIGSKIISFLLAALYARIMVTDEYSDVDVLYNSVNILLPIVTLGMSDAIIRFGMDNNYDSRKVYTTVNFSVLLGMTVYMLLTPLVNNIAAIGEYSFLLFVYCYFSCFRQMASQFVRAKGYVKLFIADGMFSIFMQLIFNLIFMLGLHWGVKGYVLSIILSDALSICGLTLLASLDKCLDTRFFDKQLWKEMLRFSVPMIPAYLLWWITAASDRFFIIAMIGKDANGIYSFGNRLPGLIMLVTTMFYNAWQMSSVEERDSRTIGKFYENVFSAYSSLMFTAAAGLIMIARPLIAILTGGAENKFYISYEFTPILVFAVLFQCLCQFLSTVYTTKKKTLNSCMTALVAASVNLLLNAVLIPEHGYWGAAIATAASYIACFAVRIFDSRRYIFFKVEYLGLLVNMIILFFMCLISAKQPPVYGIWLVLCFALTAVFNMKALLKTLRRILNKGKMTSPKGVS